MKTRLEPIDDGVNLLRLTGVDLLSIDDLASWLFVFDFFDAELRDCCRLVLGEGFYAFSNIEHRVTVECQR